MAKHPKLTIKNAIQVGDLMAKAYLNESNLDYQNSAAMPLLLVIQRFIDHQATLEFVIKFVSIAVNHLTAVEKEMFEKDQEKR
eukprot:CAMPEP_0202967216 /NCGR_PEP_ID=MMETSP1396-20130829/11990_1 /ASSEMBLY_ACC=CAM_ASM_000872 /TAXON_ID= /ORGANISM="Pseudokeronopsis sp., Strain Brazil" /LENGTH=82 /DNA_ID=CAMNT_0049691993 /DNA_START=263 /DNA_END=511 /DNA_ORIENTATION=+